MKTERKFIAYTSGFLTIIFVGLIACAYWMVHVELDLIFATAILILFPLGIWLVVRQAKKNPEEFNRGNPFYPGGIKNTKIRNIVLMIAAGVSLAQIAILIFRKS